MTNMHPCIATHFDGIELRGPHRGGDHVDYLVVAVVPEIDGVALVPREDVLPGLVGNEGGGVHAAPVADDEAVALAFLRQVKKGLLDLQHRQEKVLLEFQS